MRLADYLLQLEVERYDSVAWIERNHDGSIARSWTWWEVQKRTAAAASFLLDQAIRPGDRVVNLGRNSFGWAVLDLACSAINAVHVPIDARFSISQQEHCVELVKPSLVFSDVLSSDVLSSCKPMSFASLTSIADAHEPLDRIALPFAQNDLANILFTSGTTGVQRGVMLSHKNLRSNALAKLDAMPQGPDDCRLNFLPFAHAYARTCELSTWLISNSCIEVAIGVEEALKKAPFARPSLINGVPIFFERLEREVGPIPEGRDCIRERLGGQVRRLASGGAALPEPVRARFAAIGLPIYQGYGLTESSPVICSNRSGDLVEVGLPVKGMKVRIDERGRLWVSGDGVMLGYWQDPEATKAKIVDGWMDTGDLAEHVGKAKGVETKAIRILGRADDTLVLSSGYKVQPLPIEQKILTESWVSQCILVGTECPFPVLIVRPIEAAQQTMHPDGILARIQAILNEFPRYAIPCKVVIANDDWTKENGLLNFKGGLMRKKIESHYQSQIDAVLLSK